MSQCNLKPISTRTYHSSGSERVKSTFYTNCRLEILSQLWLWMSQVGSTSNLNNPRTRMAREDLLTVLECPMDFVIMWLTVQFNEKPPLWAFNEKPFQWKAASMKSHPSRLPLHTFSQGSTKTLPNTPNSAFGANNRNDQLKTCNIGTHSNTELT